jgi:formamidopyrimidine-DNA glycosylase
MPEGVEVKLSAELIRPLVVNRIITKVSVGNKSRYANQLPEGLKEFSESFKSSELGGWVNSPVLIADVKTQGKFMYWSFDNDWYMFSTFGMTGQWSPNAGKHVCLNIGLHDPRDIDGEFSDVYFNDPRHFGTLKFVKGKAQLLEKLNELGWDPLQDKLADHLPYLKSKLSNIHKPIGQVLMDQTIFAGVGNYIRAEALYLAKTSPWKIANQLSPDEILALCQSCVDVMQESYKHQGATIQTYKTAYGEEGRYSSCFKVYGKKIDPLGNKIIKEDTPDGRTIHWCPAVQK